MTSARPVVSRKERRTAEPLRILAFMSVLTVAFAAALVIGAVWWSATRADQVAKDRYDQTVAYALRTATDKIPYDQESVAFWNEAVENTRNAFNEQWVDVNLGVWMHDYFKHDRIYVLDHNDRVLYAMADGTKVALSDRVANRAVELLAARLRQDIASGALDRFLAQKTRIPRAVDLDVIDDRPAIISVMPIIPHTTDIVQERGTEPLIASVRFLDQSFVSDLGEAHLLDGVRFTRSADIAAGEQSFPLTTKSGEKIGDLVWDPKLPGSRILTEVLPVLVLGLLGVSFAVAFLILHLTRTYSNLVSSESQAKHLAFHDTLTGLPNRAYFNARVDEALEDVQSGQSQFALMFLDLDRFKQVNDTFGHAAGDELIRDLAASFSAFLKPGDVLARMGGDEFAMLIRGIRGRAEIEGLCRNLIDIVSKPIDLSAGPALVGVSIGIAIAPQAGTDRSELQRKADIALYQAKRSGGTHFEFFTEHMSKSVQQRRELEGDLRHALDSGTELEVVFQPIYTSGTTLSGVEALVRWNHPRAGAVSPYTFVGLAEDCGLIDRLGDLVMRRACSVASAWNIETLAVNISAMQLRQYDFSDRVLGLLAETGLDPSRLEVEVTEATLLSATEASGRNLKALRRAGVKVALDDFGTGSSSLSYLMKFEVDRIKIDRTFVQRIGRADQSDSIVQAFVSMARAFGIAVTAEGVETREQMEFLTNIGCDSLQGYLLSPPMPALRMLETIAGKGVTGRRSDTEAA